MDMMEKYRVFLVGCMLCLFWSADAATIVYNISNYDRGKQLSFFLTSVEKECQAFVDEYGKGNFELSGKSPQYVYMQYGENKQLLFVEPDGELIVNWEDGKVPYVGFEGDGADINQYLNSHKIVLTWNRDYKLCENAFLGKLDSLYAVNIESLEESRLSESFKGIEKVRVKSIVYDKVFMYPQYHKHLVKDSAYAPSDSYYKKIEKLTDFNDEWLFLPEYRNFLINAVSCLSLWKNIPHKGSLRSARYAEQYVENASIREVLINYYANSYIRNYGLKGADELIALFKKNVNSPDLIQKFQTLCGTWERIADGYYAPSFSGVNIDGRVVTLNDFKGKPVYIDVWATWCVPCRKEIPYLKALEEEYGTRIHFVSISIDKNKAAWENMIKKDGINGVQLHYNGCERFMNDYMIKGIPRFILLDREGRIVSANATRPSDPKTKKLLESLLKGE